MSVPQLVIMQRPYGFLNLLLFQSQMSVWGPSATHWDAVFDIYLPPGPVVWCLG